MDFAIGFNLDRQNLIGIDIYDASRVVIDGKRDAAVVNVNVTVQVIRRFIFPKKPQQYFESSMRGVLTVVDIPRW